jgi:hypothetical protein
MCLHQLISTRLLMKLKPYKWKASIPHLTATAQLVQYWLLCFLSSEMCGENTNPRAASCYANHVEYAFIINC